MNSNACVQGDDEMKRKIALILYYLIASKLPESDSPFAFGAKAFRRCLCRWIFDSSGDSFNIEKGVFFGGGDGISIGSRSGIGIRARIQGPLTIGDDVMMGPDVLIYTRNHNAHRTDIPMIEQGDSEAFPVSIESDCWIGARVIILPGVTIGRGSIVAAGAVVSRSIPPYSIAAGVPAKIIRSRK